MLDQLLNQHLQLWAHPGPDELQKSRPMLGSRSLSTEAVAQTPTELTEAVLRVGSKIVRLVARTQRDRADFGALSVRYGDHGAPSLGFRGRPYAKVDGA